MSAKTVLFVAFVGVLLLSSCNFTAIIDGVCGPNARENGQCIQDEGETEPQLIAPSEKVNETCARANNAPAMLHEANGISQCLELEKDSRLEGVKSATLVVYQGCIVNSNNIKVGGSEDEVQTSFSFNRVKPDGFIHVTCP